MNASSSAVLPADLKAANQERPTAGSSVPVSVTKQRGPKRFGRRDLMLLMGGGLILAAAVSWFVSNAGYETTDDATVEAHAIQVSPKVSAHVKTVHFNDNYEVKRGDLLVELDPRDFDVALAR